MNKQRPGLLRRLLGNTSGLLGLIMITIFVIAGLFAAPLAPYPPNEQHPADRLQAPSFSGYIMGTDQFGRDVYSRLLYGASNSLTVALSSVIAALLAGLAVGVPAGYVGGSVDSVLMRIVDLLFAFPAILLALFIAAVLGPGQRNTIIAIAIVYMPIFARVARASVLDVKDNEYVHAAYSIGSRHPAIVWRHIMPNALAPLIVQLSLAFSWAILTEAALSFLGLGVIPPEPSWGSELSEARLLMELAPWLAFAPGLAIMFAVLGFNLLGDGLRDVLDTRLSG
jgi:peptide/nickel transport system permease protein